MCNKDTVNKVLPIFPFLWIHLFFFDEKNVWKSIKFINVTFEQFKVSLLNMYYFILKQ